MGRKRLCILLGVQALVGACAASWVRTWIAAPARRARGAGRDRGAELKLEAGWRRAKSKDDDDEYHHHPDSRSKKDDDE